MIDLDSLLKHPAITDIIKTEDTIYIICTEKPPVIYTDKKIVTINNKELLGHPELTTILTGTSTRHKKTPLKQEILYEYSLTKATKTQKQQLAHTLNGTGGRQNQLASMEGRRIGKGAIIISPKYQEQTEELLTKHRAEYKKTIIYKGNP